MKKQNSQLGFFPSKEDKLRVVVLLARSIHIADDPYNKKDFSVWNDKRGTWVNKFIPVSLFNDNPIDQKIGSIRVFTDDENVFIEDEVLKYQFPKNLTEYITDKLLKILKSN